MFTTIKTFALVLSVPVCLSICFSVNVIKTTKAINNVPKTILIVAK